MDAASDPIKSLIETTGWTCDDLLQKLLQYKNLQSKSSDQPKDTSSDICPENESQNVETGSDCPEKIDNPGQDAHSECINNSLDDNHDSLDGDLKIDENHHQTVSEGPEETTTETRSMETTTENISVDVGHEEKVSRIDLNNESLELTKELEMPVLIEFDEEESESQSKIGDEKVELSPLGNNQEESKDSPENSLMIGLSPLRCNEEFPCESENEYESSSCPKNFQKNQTLPNSTYDHEFDLSNNHAVYLANASISDKLVQKLSDGLQSENEVPNENVIEVCQIDDLEIAHAKPLLKLRSDLFAGDSKGNFNPSDNEAENEENSPEIKEFLKNVEEVTGEVKNHTSPKKSLLSNLTETNRSDELRIRRVKMGFVKKRILQKAIKCINISESRKIEQIKRNGAFSTETTGFHCDNDSANANPALEEEVRKNLKLQLCSLRNRKKTTDLFKEKYKIDNSKITYDKKKVLNAISSPAINTSPTKVTPSEEVSEDNIDLEQGGREKSMFSLSEDTNFMIVDVQGGVEFPDVSETVEKPIDTSSDLIKLTKTNDVTKIKGWQNKKFQLSQEKSQKDSSDIKSVQCDSPEPNCRKTKSNIDQSDNVEKQELSPFVSNTLDEFLTENATLNISYNIPKLMGTEESINTQKYNTVVIPQIETTTTYDSDKNEESETEKPKPVKPKTLAEKRRMLESTKVIGKKEEIAFSRTSFVLYNGQKFFVPTKRSKECVVNIKHTPKPFYHKAKVKTSNDNKNSKKLSLLDLYHQKNNNISYKPGPLSKKPKLQNEESTSKWHTEIRRLPTVKLNVIPEVGKPIPSHLAHFFKFGPKIEEDRLELALSAVLDNKPQKQGFRLTVPYANNQKYILVRKKNTIPFNTVYDVSPEKNTVQSVLDDIISYVENKESENSIIRDAEVYIEEDTAVQRGTNGTTEISPVKNPKRRKLDSELLRLSCKVLSVSVDDTEENESIKCHKSTCKLGCVCKSLVCTPRLPMHCSKVDCMFECKCSTNMNISLEGSTLSCDTVTRLEDQAKRNLAKVEKEFTQTIIHTNDKTILIPSSDRNKTKRIKRMPKRYSDFLEDFDIEKDIVSSKKESKRNSLKEFSNCFVRLQKLDMQGIIPLCLYHNCYNCSCILTSGRKSNPSSEMESANIVQYKGIKRRKLSVEKKKSVKESKEKSEVNLSDDNSSDSDYMEELKILGRRKFKQLGGCARVSGVHPEVLARNEIPFYRNKLRSKVKNTENAIYFDKTSLRDSSYLESDTEFIDITTPLQISASDRLKISIMKKHRYKRKNSSEDPSDRSKKIKKCPDEDSICDSEKVGNLPCNAVFDGEIIVPTNENKDFVKKLGVKSAAAYMRLLPWNDLLRNYYGHKVNIWCPSNSNKNMLLNLSEKGPPPGYIEITESKRKNGIMNWILSKQLPNNTPSNLVHLILSPKNNYFEITGICLKNISQEEKDKKLIDYKKNDKAQSKLSIVPETSSIPYEKFFNHKNHKNEANVLMITQKDYDKQDSYVMSDSLQFDTSPISVGLPSFESLRWRIVFLNSNFTFLSFIKNDYSIKYTDLMNIMKRAQDANRTICLQSKTLSKGYSKNNYGIYAVPEFADRLFIGPYQIHEYHGLQTLRYLKQELVPTDYFESIQGGVLPNKKKDMWLLSKELYSRLVLSQKKKMNMANSSRSKPTIADTEYAVLTPLPNASKNSSEENQSYLKHAEELQNWNSQFLDESGKFITSDDLETKPFIKFPEFTILNEKRMRLQDYNCYLMTNIPRFGYLGAIKYEETDEIEVNWPFGNKVLRFTNFLYAIQFIQRRFNNLLVSVPSTFNIRIALSEDIDKLKTLSPVDPKLLNGTHLCGIFGVLDSRKLTSELALTLGTTQEEVLERLAKRAQFLGSLEIEKLKAQEKDLIETKKKLIMIKQNYFKKYMELLKLLPEDKRIEDYTNYRQKLNGTFKEEEETTITEDPKSSGTVIECIEISDSDPEEQSNTESVELTPKKKTTLKLPEVMQSILKPKASPVQTTPISSDNENLRSMENFKLVRTSSGKMVLVKDNSGGSLSRSLTGMKMKIRNNKIVEHNLE